MSKDKNLQPDERSVRVFNLSQLAAILGITSTLIMFWQFTRDVHKDNVELRERLVTIEQKLWPKEK